MPDKKTLAHIIMTEEQYITDYTSATMSSTTDMLENIVDLQTQFAKRFHSKFIKGSQKEIIDEGSAAPRAASQMIQANLAAITNEVEEIRDWLPWKHWKTYKGFDIELEEIRLEYIDLLHFVVEGMILLGMDGQDIHRYYVSKMKENLRRQKEGY